MKAICPFSWVTYVSEIQRRLFDHLCVEASLTVCGYLLFSC